MNIAIFSDSYLPTKSGIVTVVIQLKEQLMKLGHNVVLNHLFQRAVVDAVSLG